MAKPFVSIVESILDHHCLFWFPAVVFSAYYGYRALLIQKQAVDSQNKRLDAANKLNSCQTIPLQGRRWKRWERWIVHNPQDIIFNVACSLVGWCSLRVLCYVYLNWSFSQISTGASALLIFLVFVVINGISGTLPNLIMIGRLFGGK